jgi:hypothetical protein
MGQHREVLPRLSCDRALRRKYSRGGTHVCEEELLSVFRVAHGAVGLLLFSLATQETTSSAAASTLARDSLTRMLAIMGATSESPRPPSRLFVDADFSYSALRERTGMGITSEIVKRQLKEFADSVSERALNRCQTPRAECSRETLSLRIASAQLSKKGDSLRLRMVGARQSPASLDRQFRVASPASVNTTEQWLLYRLIAGRWHFIRNEGGFESLGARDW